MKADCVILAAGLSSRMGQNKLLLEIDGRTVIERCISAFYESSSKIIVVTGRYHEDIQNCLLGYSKVHIVYHKRYQQGMFSSVKEGIKHVESERFFITPGDYPLLKADTVNRMLSKAGTLVVPIFQGKQGHPVLLHKKFVPAVLNSRANSLRECLNDFSAEKQQLLVDDIGVVMDMDTIEEYNAISGRL